VPGPFPGLDVSGDQGTAWIQGYVVLPANSTRVRFKSVAGSECQRRYDMAIDDVQLSSASLPAKTISCSFDEPFLCGWTTELRAGPPQSNRWTRQTGSTPESYTGPDAAKDGLYYMYTDWVVANSIFYLESPTVSATTEDRALTFWYHMEMRCGYGTPTADGTLSVEYYGTSNGQVVGWYSVPGPFPGLDVSGDQGTAWIQGYVVLPANSTRVRFKSVAGSECQRRYDMAIDDVQLSSASLPAKTISCSFDEPFLCGWTTELRAGPPQSNRWTRQTGSTPESYTGPDAAKDGLYYMYTDWVVANSIFYLESPTVNASTSGRELTFWYHMEFLCGYGTPTDDGILSVEHWDGSAWWPLSGGTLSGHKGSEWTKKSLTFPSGSTAVRFKGEAGSECARRFDMAVDNVILEGEIPGVTAFGDTDVQEDDTDYSSEPSTGESSGAGGSGTTGSTGGGSDFGSVVGTIIGVLIVCCCVCGGCVCFAKAFENCGSSGGTVRVAPAPPTPTKDVEAPPPPPARKETFKDEVRPAQPAQKLPEGPANVQREDSVLAGNNYDARRSQIKRMERVESLTRKEEKEAEAKQQQQRSEEERAAAEIAVVAAVGEGRACEVAIKHISAWTAGFSSERLMASGAFGDVYKGVIPGLSRLGRGKAMVAVKRLKKDMMVAGGADHWKREINLLRCALIHIHYKCNHQTLDPRPGG